MIYGVFLVFLFDMQGVPHSFLFCFQVAVVVFVGLYLNRDILDDFQSVCFQSNSFCRIIGQEAHFVNAKVSEHLSTASVVAFIGLESQVYVGFDCIHAFFL